MVPFKRNQGIVSDTEEHFNFELNKGRRIIEQAYGIWMVKITVSEVEEIRRQSHQQTQCVLHNVALRFNQYEIDNDDDGEDNNNDVWILGTDADVAKNSYEEVPREKVGNDEGNVSL